MQGHKWDLANPTVDKGTTTIQYNSGNLAVNISHEVTVAELLFTNEYSSGLKTVTAASTGVAYTVTFPYSFGVDLDNYIIYMVSTISIPSLSQSFTIENIVNETPDL